jgi:hypothetical protein
MIAGQPKQYRRAVRSEYGHTEVLHIRLVLQLSPAACLSRQRLNLTDRLHQQVIGNYGSSDLCGPFFGHRKKLWYDPTT